MKPQLVTLLKAAVSAVILVVVIRQIGLFTILNLLSSVELLYYLPITAITVFSLAFNATNVWVFLDAVGKRVTWRTVLRYSMLSWSIGLLTPGKIGESSIVYLLKKEGVPPHEGAAIALLDKLVSFSVLLFCALIVALLFFGISQMVNIVLFILVLLFVIFFLSSEMGRAFVKRYLFAPYARFYSRFSQTFEHFVKTQYRRLFFVGALTIIKWIMNGFAMVLIFTSLGVKGPVFFILLINAALVILNVIPFTYHGIGVKEAVSATIYQFIGIPPEAAVAATIIANLLAYGFCAVVILLHGNEFKRARSGAGNILEAP